METNPNWYTFLKAQLNSAGLNPFRRGRSPLQQKMLGGLNWGNPYEQFGDPHWGAMFQNDPLDLVLDIQHMLSPMRAFLSDEPGMRQQFGPPVINDYGKLRFPDVNIPLNWRLRQVAPQLWEPPEPRPLRPGQDWNVSPVGWLG